MASTACGFTSGDLLALNGPTLMVDIGFDPTFQPGESAKPTAGIAGVQALVDTGATECCIDNLLAASLNLPVVDRKPISGVGGRITVNVYLAQIHVPSLPFTIYGQFAGVDLVAGGQGHVALMGRTFLRHLQMTYDGVSGAVTLSWNPPAAPPAPKP